MFKDILLIACFLTPFIHAHGYLLQPTVRGLQYLTPGNPDDFLKQPVNKDSPRLAPTMSDPKFSLVPAVQQVCGGFTKAEPAWVDVTPGQKLTVGYKITAPHHGWLTYRLSTTGLDTDFKNLTAPFEMSTSNTGTHTSVVPLPQDLKCPKAGCTLQFYWNASGFSDSTNEIFVNCMDLRIKGGSASSSASTSDVAVPSPSAVAVSTATTDATTDASTGTIISTSSTPISVSTTTDSVIAPTTDAVTSYATTTSGQRCKAI